MVLDLTHSAVISTQILDWVRGKGAILIVTHDNPDPDSLAAAYALRHLILVKTGQAATIAFGGIIGRGENRVMVRELEINAICIDSLDPTAYEVVCMVDTQPGTGNNSFPADRPVDVIIDHHPIKKGTAKSRWVDVRVDYGASATILFEYLMAQDVKFATKLATILFYAIKSETQSLGREWSRADREAYLSLFPRCNNRILYQIDHPPAPREYFRFISTGFDNAKILGDVLVFNVHNINNPDIVAELADILMRVEGITLVLGMGCYEDQGVISMRTCDPEIKSGTLLRNVMSSLGTAGGHGMIAGGQIRNMPKDVDSQKLIEAEVTRRLFAALDREQPEPTLLIEE